MQNLARLYIKGIVWLHNIPSSIVSDKDPKFIFIYFLYLVSIGLTFVLIKIIF